MAATANIKAIITAQDNASKVVQEFGANVDKQSDKINKSVTTKINASFTQLLTIAAGAGVATKKMLGVIDDTLDAANRQQSALVGLSSITKAFGQDTEEAKEAAASLATDGLMTVGDAALGLKNLLAAGFNLDQAIQLMKRFKDSAAFGRQSALSFGQAVTSATEGIKNGNSILVDNAGVTKNLSIILEEAGFSAQDLMRATEDASVRQAIFNGILKETNPQLGDAGRLTDTFAGKQAMLSAESEKLKARIGEALQPALVKLLEVVTPLVEKFAKFTEEHPGVVAAMLLITTVALGLLSVLGTLGLAVAGLGPVFTAMAAVASGAISGVTAVVGGLSTALSSMVAFVGGPVAAAGWAAFAIVAIAAIYKVRQEGQKLQQELDAVTDAVRDFGESKGEFIASLGRALREGRISQSEYNRRLSAYNQGIAGRAAGGTVHQNQPYIVGERGAELFVPSQSGQIIPNGESTGTTNINVNIGMYAGTQMEKRRMAEELLKSLRDVASSNGISLGQMIGS